ncbi:adhesive plaque matrix protein-like [Schistocerca americana]|uniref:adhesive plaque matrix protein-like n=1 Tax=Schistocerca americana TaxID=7009 RepID=UPI001F4FCDB9|nr:adhesive plaque matrix protein-like [Schistocerca americana]
MADNTFIAAPYPYDYDIPSVGYPLSDFTSDDSIYYPPDYTLSSVPTAGSPLRYASAYPLPPPLTVPYFLPHFREGYSPVEYSVTDNPFTAAPYPYGYDTPSSGPVSYPGDYFVPHLYPDSFRYPFDGTLPPSFPETHFLSPFLENQTPVEHILPVHATVNADTYPSEYHIPFLPTESSQLGYPGNYHPPLSSLVTHTPTSLFDEYGPKENLPGGYASTSTLPHMTENEILPYPAGAFNSFGYQGSYSEQLLSPAENLIQPSVFTDYQFPVFPAAASLQNFNFATIEKPPPETLTPFDQPVPLTLDPPTFTPPLPPTSDLPPILNALYPQDFSGVGVTPLYSDRLMANPPTYPTSSILLSTDDSKPWTGLPSPFGQFIPPASYPPMLTPALPLPPFGENSFPTLLPKEYSIPVENDYLHNTSPQGTNSMQFLPATFPSPFSVSPFSSTLPEPYLGLLPPISDLPPVLNALYPQYFSSADQTPPYSERLMVNPTTYPAESTLLSTDTKIVSDENLYTPPSEPCTSETYNTGCHSSPPVVLLLTCDGPSTVLSDVISLLGNQRSWILYHPGTQDLPLNTLLDSNPRSDSFQELLLKPLVDTPPETLVFPNVHLDWSSPPEISKFSQSSSGSYPWNDII